MTERDDGRWRRWLRRALIVLAALQLLYLTFGNLFLNAGLGQRLLGHKPEKFQADWASGWTVWPGRAHVRELHLRGQSRRVRWELELAEASFSYSVLGLAAKRFLARDIVGSGVNFRLRLRPRVGDAPDDDGAAPEITGFPTPLEAPQGPRPPPRRWPWHISLAGVDVDGVREVWIEDQRVLGNGRLTGGVWFEPRGPMAMERAVLEMADGRILIGEETVAEEVRLTCEAHFDRFVPRENRGRPALRFLSGRVRFESPRASFGFLERYFARVPWLDVDGSGQVLADVPIVDGKLAAGGRLELEARDLTVSALEFAAAGEGGIRGEVTAAGGGTETRLAAQLTSFELWRQDGRRRDQEGRRQDGDASTETLVRGNDLRLTVRGGEIDLVEGPPELDLHVAIAPSEIPQLAAYNTFLPPASGLSIRSGTGSFSGELSLRNSEDSGTGSIDIRARQAALLFGDLESVGDLSFSLKLRGAELSRRRFDVSGSRLELEHYAVVDAGRRENDAGWWGRIELQQAEIQGGEPPSLTGRIDAEIRDSRPIVAFIAEKKPLVGWLESLLTVQEVAAEGALRVDPGAWAIDDLRITGERLEILGNSLRLSEGQTNGLLYFARGPLSAAVEIDGGKRDWKLFRARRWYDQRADGRATGAGAP